MTTEIVTDAAALQSLRSEWAKLQPLLPGDLPGSAMTLEAFVEAAATGCQPARPLVAVARDASGKATTIAPLVYAAGKKKFAVGKRPPIELPVRILWSPGTTFLGAVDSEAIRAIFSRVRRLSGFDLVRLGSVPTNSHLYQSLASLHGPSWRFSTPTIWQNWVIDLPRTFDEYLAKFDSKARYNLRRTARKFEEALGGEFAVISAPDQVEAFLVEADRLSRQTYQWQLGERFVNNDSTRSQLLRSAELGELRSYLLYANGQACAYIRGVLRSGVFAYLATGYDVKYTNWSPGSVALMKAVADLIEQADCEIFNFGMGDWPYKSRFGTRSYECAQVEIAPTNRAWAMCLLAMDTALRCAKKSLKALMRRPRSR